MTNTEGGTDDEEFRVAAIKDRVDTTMQVWMSLTMGPFIPRHLRWARICQNPLFCRKKMLNGVGRGGWQGAQRIAGVTKHGLIETINAAAMGNRADAR